jgi:hypothetical protein
VLWKHGTFFFATITHLLIESTHIKEVSDMLRFWIMAIIDEIRYRKNIEDEFEVDNDFIIK